MEKFFKRPWLIVAVVAAITVFFALQLPKTELDNDMKGFLPRENEVFLTSEHLNDTFGESVDMFIGLERKYGTVFDQAFLARIREFQDTVEQIAIVKDVTSILTMPYITADGDSIIVTDLVDEDFTGTPDEIAELKRRLSSWELYDGATVSRDFSATQIVVTLNVPEWELQLPEISADVKNIRIAAEETFSKSATVYLTGLPTIMDTVNSSMRTDMGMLVPFVLVVILVILFFSFRRLTFVALSLLTVIIAVIWAVGAMPLLGFKMSIIMIILPVILIAVGSAYGIHVISHYLDDAKGKIMAREEHRALVFGVVRRVLKPVLLAGLTTIAGFVSFCFTWLVPMRDFGAFSTFGVIVSLIVSITFLPALLIIRGPEKEKTAAKARAKKVSRMGTSTGHEQREGSRLDTALADVLTVVAGKKAMVVVIAAAVAVFAVYGVSKLIVDNSTIEYFREDSDIPRSDRFIREYFGGSTSVTVAVEADTTEELLTPEVLTALDNLSAYLTERVPHVGKVSGFTDMLKRMNQMFNVDESPDGVRTRAVRADTAGSDFGFGDFGGFDDEDFTEASYGEDEVSSPKTPPALPETSITFAQLSSAAGKHTNMSANELARELARQTNYEGRAYYEIPADPARYGKSTSEELTSLITNYLVLVGGDSDDRYSNDPLEPTAISSSIQINSKWQKDTDAVIAAANDYAAANFPKNVRVLVGGNAALSGEITNMVMHSQIVSIIVAILMVIVILSIANKSLAAGLLAAVPLSLAILCNFGIMGFLGVTLNLGTSLIASLAVGIGIDYTIHFMEFFKAEYAVDGAAGAGGNFLWRTFAGSGKAILTNAVSVSAGFAVLALSQFRIMAEMGGLIALSMIITAVISLTLMPVLFMLVKPRFIYGNS